jgi:hypothetical protein
LIQFARLPSLDSFGFFPAGGKRLITFNPVDRPARRKRRPITIPSSSSVRELLDTRQFVSVSRAGSGFAACASVRLWRLLITTCQPTGSTSGGMLLMALYMMG